MPIHELCLSESREPNSFDFSAERRQSARREAIVYALASSGHGMTTDQIADYINRRHLHTRNDSEPVSSKQVYAVIMRYPSIFCKAEGRIMLIM